MGTITALEVQKRNKKRVSVFVDDEYAFSLTLEEAAKLRKGQSLTDQQIITLRGEDSVIRAVDDAARFLAPRPRSEHEVRQKLAERETAPEVIDLAIRRLQELGYLDDRAFALFWVQNRTTFRPLSPKALRYELRQKGVTEEIISEILTEVDADDAAYRAAEGQVRRLRGTNRKEFRTKMSAFLQRRGFAYDRIRATVDRLIEELEPEFFGEADSSDDPPWEEG